MGIGISKQIIQIGDLIELICPQGKYLTLIGGTLGGLTGSLIYIDQSCKNNELSQVFFIPKTLLMGLIGASIGSTFFYSIPVLIPSSIVGMISYNLYAIIEKL